MIPSDISIQLLNTYDAARVSPSARSMPFERMMIDLIATRQQLEALGFAGVLLRLAVNGHTQNEMARATRRDARQVARRLDRMLAARARQRKAER